LKDERFKATEAIFKSNLISRKEDEGMYRSFMLSGKAPKMYGRVILSGGNTKFRGMDKRIEKEISEKSGIKIDDVHVTSPLDHSVWQGGSMLAVQLDDNQWVTKAEYEEEGVHIVNKKCPYFGK